MIISQDTDGMTHPGEIDMQWAIGRKKPFFVGKRSVEILEAQPMKRKLVGFVLPANSPKPLEGHLVLNGADISGNVTSCEYSQTLGQIIGLGYSAYDGTQNVYAGYVELSAPVLEQLELSAAMRYDKYESGEGKATPKLGVKWTPTDWLALRASYAERVAAAQQGSTRPLRKFLLESSDFLAGQAERAPYRVGQRLKLSEHQTRIPEGKVKLVPRIRWLIHRKRSAAPPCRKCLDHPGRTTGRA